MSADRYVLIMEQYKLYRLAPQVKGREKTEEQGPDPSIHVWNMLRTETLKAKRMMMEVEVTTWEDFSSHKLYKIS
jgi:hypothetical protein